MTCPLCRQETFYYDKNTRSKGLSDQMMEEIDTEWISILEMYKSKIPVKIFLQFIEKYFIQKEKKYVWYRQKNKYIKTHFQFICFEKVLFKKKLTNDEIQMMKSFIFS
jgi:hypothetical protein